MNPAQLDIDAIIKGLTPAQMADMLAMLEELDNRKRMDAARNDFLAFIALIDRTYKFGAHLKRLGRLLMDAEVGSKDRIAVSMAPRFGKSQMISIYFPAWYLGRNPDHKVIVASHTADLAVDMARKVRNLMQTEEYRKIFPNVRIATDAKAAGKWNTSVGGEFYAIGTGGALAGRGAHLVLVDDPLSEQDIKAGNTTSLDTTYEWFRAGLRTRLMPGGRIVALHCLAGDTRVLQADGTEKPIRDVRPGDMVAGYVNKALQPAKVLGWSNQGVDHIFAVALRSGVIIRGNERHPLLVSTNGAEQWVTIKNLRPGMHLVSTTGAQTHPIAKPCGDCASPVTTRNTTPNAPQGGVLSLLSAKITHALRKDVRALGGLSSSPAPVARATRESTTTRKTQTPLAALWDTTASGKANPAPLKAVGSLRTLTVCVSRVARKLIMLSGNLRVLTTAPQSGATPISKCSMVSQERSTTKCMPIKVGDALYAGSLLTMETPQPRGKSADWLSTTATRLTKFARSCVTHAISSSKSETLLSYYEKLLSTSSFTLDEIVSITPDGAEEVFDIQVEGAESFVANGIVSHNTRWHQRDLIGRLVKDAALNPDADQYEVFEFPAILHEGTDEAKSLWPEQWSMESLLRTKASMPLWQWNAQYQQNPTAAESAIVKRDWIRWWPKEDPPQVDFIIQSWDTALTTKERSDWSVCQTWGVWTNEETGTTDLILLNCVKGKWEFPELKQEAHDQFAQWQPDSVIIEAKASGQPLIDEMRRSGIFVQDFSPGKGQDKIARLNAVTDMFSAGQVWFPETAWAQEVVEELLAFPAGEHDDAVDALTLALRRARTGGLLRLNTDHEDNEYFPKPRRKGAYTV